MTRAGQEISIETERLLLYPPEPAFAAGVARYLRTNRHHFAAWDPRRPSDAFTAAGQNKRLAQAATDIADGRSLGWWLFLRDQPGTPIGQMNFTQVSRGISQSAMLGYGIAHLHQGHGLMSEALRAGLAEVFGPRVKLHRVQANARPENLRSLALLERLGFQREGLARQYLYIDGAWRDHVMTALVNPAWSVDVGPAGV